VSNTSKLSVTSVASGGTV